MNKTVRFKCYRGKHSQSTDVHQGNPLKKLGCFFWGGGWGVGGGVECVVMILSRSRPHKI